MTKSAAWFVPGYNSGVSRRVYIDWARGIAVLLMIEAHTMDAWTRAADRHGVRVSRRDGPRRVRGAAVSLAGGPRRRAARRRADRPSGTGSRRAPRASRRWPAGAASRSSSSPFCSACRGSSSRPASQPVTLFRVDILNIMGPAMVGGGPGLGRWREPSAARVACVRRRRDCDRAC